MPPGGGGGGSGGSGPEGSGSNDEEARRSKAKLLGLAAAAVAVSAAFLLVPNANADDGEHHERMSITEIAEWVIEHALFSVRPPAQRELDPCGLARRGRRRPQRRACARLARLAPGSASCARLRGPPGAPLRPGRTARGADAR